MKVFLVTYRKTIEVPCLILAEDKEDAYEKHGEGGEAWMQDWDATDDSCLNAVEVTTADQAIDFAIDWQKQLDSRAISYKNLPRSRSSLKP